MISSRSAVVTLPEDKQILITREFDAPAALVYKAYTTPELVRRWWHANRGEMTVCDIDLRVGGSWRFVMEAPNFGEVAFHGEYREIVPNERLVSTEIYEIPGQGDSPPTVNTATFTDVDGRTRLEVLVQCPDKTVRDIIIVSGMEGGMQESMDALEQVAISLQ